MFGAGALLMGDKAEKTIAVIAELQKIFFRMIAFIMYLAPLGAFGAMAYTVGLHGGTALVSLGQLILLVYGSCIVFIFVVLGLVSAAFGFSIFSILKLVREEFLLVLGTSSSEVALPRLIEKLERAGCERSIVGLVLPTGYSFNTDGTSIYMSMVVIFISQATDTPLTIAQQLGILAVLLFTSKGGAAVSGAGFVKLAATLQSVKTLPLSGLGVLIGVDRFMSEAALDHQHDRQRGGHPGGRALGGCVRPEEIRGIHEEPESGISPVAEARRTLPAPDPRPVVTSI